MVTLEHIGSGKVREIYSLDDSHLLLVATDRISAFDVVLPNLIPDKGRVLTGLTLFWLELLGTPNHFVTTDVSNLADEAKDLAGRAMVVRRADVIPMECVVRGFLYGSAWHEYQSGGGPTVEHLPTGLQRGDRLQDPIFTPATKAVQGHDQNLTEAEARNLVGDELYEELRSRSKDIFERAGAYADAHGLLLADTKFEFGFVDDELIVIDEVLTPDSSRYWPKGEWHPPALVPSYDKQYVRDWLETTGWNHTPPAPSLPVDVIEETSARYRKAYETLTERPFAEYLAEHA